MNLCRGSLKSSIERLFTFLILFLFLPLSGLSAQQVIFTIAPSVNDVPLGKYIEILEDKTGNLTIEDVTSPEILQRFSPSNQEEPGFGFTSSVYWARLTVKNPLHDSVEWLLEIGYPLIDFIDLYIPDGNGDFLIKKTGDRLPFNSREISYRNVLFRLNENPDGQKTYYVRFETSSSMNFPLHFWLQAALLKKISAEQIIFGVFYGAVVIMIIYNVFLFIGFRDRSYFYYVLFITAWGMTQLAINGLAFQYLWSKWIWWANVNLPFFAFATCTTINQLGRSGLSTNENAPLWDKILKFENILFIAGMLFSLLMPYAFSVRIAAASAIIAVVGLIIISLICLKQRHRPAYYFTTAWSLFFFGVILLSLKGFGVLPSNFITNWSIQIGAFALLVLLSLALGDRINTEKKEKYLAQKAALKSQQQLVETLKESERILEEKVTERTAELKTKNISLNKKTKELQDSYKNVTMLGEVGQKITSTFDFEEISNMIYETVKALMDLSIFAIGIYREDEQTIDFVYCMRKSKRMPPLTVAITENEFSVWCIKNCQPIFIRDVEQEKSKYLPSGIELSPDAYGKSMIYLPLVVEERIIGVATVHSFTKNAYTNYHLDILRTLTSYGAIALDNANAYLQIKKAHEELEMTQAQLVHVEKMASLGEVTAGIAHEIKNPLNFVNNFAEVSVELADELQEDLEEYKDKMETDDYENIKKTLADIKQNVVVIHDNGKRADSIVRSMMDHARGTKGGREAVDINELLDKSVNLAYHGYRAKNSTFNVDFQKNYDASLAPVEMIPQDLSRVFLNVLGNACYAVRAKDKEQGESYSPTITVSTKGLSGMVEIRIRDNGPGIPEEIRDKIFNPFFTTKPVGEGNTGLGLSISYDIVVEGHQGELKVDSAPGEFTEFVLRLPKE